MNILEQNQDNEFIQAERAIMAVCCDCSRCGCAIYSDSQVSLVSDRQDSGDPYKGLDIIIQRFDPKVVIVSVAQRRLISFLEARFKIKIQDLSKTRSSTRGQKRVTPSQVLSVDLASQFSSNAPSIPSQATISIPGQQVGQSSCSRQPGPNLNNENQMNLDSADEVEELSLQDFAEERFTLAIVPNSWFSLSHALNKLMNCEMIGSRNFSSSEQKLLFVSTKVKKSVDACAIRSISAIDNFLEKELIFDPVAAATQSRAISQAMLEGICQSQATSSKEQDNFELSYHMPILDVKYVDPGPFLSVDKISMESLNIFSEFKSSRENEQDLVTSLYELLNRCQSRQGKRYLRTMLVWPLQDIEELRRRHDAVDFFVNPDNRHLRDQIVVELKNVIPLSGLLTKLTHSVGSYREMASLYKALWSFTSIIDVLKTSDHSGFEILDRIVQLDSAEFRSTTDSIINVVDFEASKKGGRIEVCLGIDQFVDEKRELIKNLSKFCDEVAIQETAKYRNSIGKVFKVIYIPRIGFLSCVEFTSRSEMLQMRASREIDILLFTEQSIYFKTKRMEELDANAGDIACDLIDVQEKVLIELQRELLQHSEVILNLMELCGELDCLIAFATISAERGYTRPEFVSSQDEIDIRNAYHPLQSIQENLVPNDVHFYKDSLGQIAKVMILTGPNACGKSTYIRTVCLITYMAQVGCFVPASRAKLPIIDAILTSLHTAYSISTGLSSFASDLRQINFALSQSTAKSLVAIDEFGEGTQAADGLLLLKGLVIYFAKRAQTSPYVMIATHFNRLINHLQSYTEQIIYKTMRVSRDLSKDSIVYEFKIEDGVGEVTLADQVAARAGIPQRIIDRAKQIRSMITEGRAITPRPPHGA